MDENKSITYDLYAVANHFGNGYSGILTFNDR